MRKVVLIILCLFIGKVYALDTEKEVKSTVSEVTVYLEGAQETRKSTIDLPQGKTTLKFVGLSPFIDAKSIQLKVDGEVTVLTVNHQLNHLLKVEKSQTLKDLDSQIEVVDTKINLENAYLNIIQEDMAFLKENRMMSGKDQSLSVLTLKEASEFFSNKLTALNLKQIERLKTLNELNLHKRDLESQYESIVGKKEYATSEVLVLVESKKPVTVSLNLSYMVSNAGWYPSYDIRAKNISEPLEVVYKANIRQDTKNDWTNVKLKLSSYNPTVSGVAPELKPYLLDYNSAPPVYGKSLSSVKGRVTDANNTPLVGVMVMVDGSNISTVTNLEGYYSITLPSNAFRLKFSYIGYNQQTVPLTGSEQNVVLYESKNDLNEIVVTGYGFERGIDIADLEQDKVAVEERPGKLKAKLTGAINLPEQTQVEKQVSVEFEIKEPYTIQTDNKVMTVNMEELSIPVSFQYFSVPKINKEAFLIAQLMDWEKYNFLEGEANVFFEDTYVGKTVFDVNAATDTMTISLGRDKKVSVQREKIKEYTTKQFIGNKKEVTRDWKTTVRNNRSEAINMLVMDQVPVTTNAEIEVTTKTTPDANISTEDGQVKWVFNLEPGKTRVLDLKYVVKYPKIKNLIIE